MSEHIESIFSLSDFVEKVSSLRKPLSSHGWTRFSEFLFRGHSEIVKDIKPSLVRDRTSSVVDSLFNYERDMIAMMHYEAPDIFHDRLLPIELLALLQHHGLPTRLLDVTENALVALYFACEQINDSDGEVIVFKNNDKDVYTHVLMQAIADGYRLFGCDNSEICLSEFFSRACDQSYFAELRHLRDFWAKDMSKIPDNMSFLKSPSNWIKDVCNKPLFVYAPIHVLRQRVQCGRYILFPNDICYDDKIWKDFVFTSNIIGINKKADCIECIYVVPADVKSTIREDLSQFGITERTLFPDNIDKMSKNIVNKFTWCSKHYT